MRIAYCGGSSNVPLQSGRVVEGFQILIELRIHIRLKQEIMLAIVQNTVLTINN